MRFGAEHVRRMQTARRAFRNWAPLLGTMLVDGVGWRQEELAAVTRPGSRMRCPMAARSALFEVYGEDIFGLEAVQPELERRHASFYVLDIGAHIGTFTVLACERLPQARCVCFEPSATSLRYLEDNVRRSHLESRVTIRAAAVSAQTGWASLVEPFPGGLGTSINNGANRGTVNSHRVRTVALDGVVNALDAPVGLIKMNCEGAEYEIVSRTADSTWEDVSCLLLEYHPIPGESWVDLLRKVQQLGFQLCRQVSFSQDMGIAAFVKVA